MLHPALRFVIVARWKNRLRSLLRRLKTPSGIFGTVFLLLMIASMSLGSAFGAPTPVETKKAMLTSFLGFLMILGVLGGIGQRGLLFSKADLDFVFPAPFTRGQLLAYHFIPHHVAGSLLALMYVLFLGGRTMPSPLSCFLGFVLCQITSGHLAAFAAELSMLLADKFYARMRRVTVALAVLLSIGGLLAVVLSIGEAGEVGDRLRIAWDSPWLRVALYPAVAAGELAVARTFEASIVPMLGLLACAVGSFYLVRLLNVDFLENSFTATNRFRTRMENAKRGVHTAKVKKSSRGPRGRSFRGAGAVLWVNMLIMRRQLRAVLGGVIVVVAMLALFGRRTTNPVTVLTVLTMVPLWVALPVGFRLPREQLMQIRQLPLKPLAVVASLIAVPVLVPFVLQWLGTLGLVATGRVPMLTGLAALPAFLAVGTTMASVEAVFLLRQAEPNQLNFFQSIMRLLVQMVALLPGLIGLVVGALLLRDESLAVLLATIVQSIMACLCMGWLGARFLRKELILHDA